MDKNKVMNTKFFFMFLITTFMLVACSKKDVGYGYGKKKGPIKKSADGKMMKL